MLPCAVQRQKQRRSDLRRLSIAALLFANISAHCSPHSALLHYQHLAARSEHLCVYMCMCVYSMVEHVYMCMCVYMCMVVRVVYMCMVVRVYVYVRVRV